MKYKFITIKQFAKAIIEAPIDTLFDFTLDQSEDDFRHGEPEGWYGAKITRIFDIPVFCVGNYGGYHLDTADVAFDKPTSLTNITTKLDHILFCNTAWDSETKFCVEVTEENKKYLEDM